MSLKLTPARRRILDLALRSDSGNPWPLIGMRQRTGGAMTRMFDEMKAQGLFDVCNEITTKGRIAALSPRVKYAGRSFRRFVAPGERDGGSVVRCIFCGQIDEPEVHESFACRGSPR